MVNESRFKMSQERLDELKAELDYLQTVREKEVAEQIKEARSFGDLSENSEYDEAKTEQGKLYSKIAEITALIENAEVIEATTVADTAGHGSKVKVKDLELGDEMQFQIVGGQEVNPLDGKISSDSPLGRSLIGHGVGETIVVESPAGSSRYEILSINI